MKFLGLKCENFKFDVKICKFQKFEIQKFQKFEFEFAKFFAKIFANFFVFF